MIVELCSLLPALLATHEPAAAPAVGDQLVARTLGVMGTELEIKAIGPDVEVLEKAIDAAVAEIRRVEDLMTDWRASPLMELNDAAGAGPTKAPAELVELISRGVLLGELTYGSFDITYAAVGALWDFKAEPPPVPDTETLAEALTRVGYAKVTIDEEASTVDLPQGMRIGLGGIAKGHGVDRAMAVLMEHGVEHGLVSAGGDLKALGRKFGEPWEIAIRHPRERERVLAVLPISNTCVMTSGDYERFFVHEGKRYHHILDPRTGLPATGCMSATIVAQNAANADALATAMCVLGPEKGLALVEELPNVEALLVGLDGKVHVSSGLRDHDR